MRTTAGQELKSYGDTMRRSVRVAAFCLAGQAASLLIEALWVGVASNWSEAAREYAGPHPVRHATQLVLGAAVVFLVARSVLRGRRWAWYVGMYYGGAISVIGILLAFGLGIGVFVEPSIRALVRKHLFEAGGLISSVILCGVTVVKLREEKTRQYFFHDYWPPASKATIL